MNMTANTIAHGIVLTDAAARKVQELIREENNADLKLRVYISGGGCSGFQYGFSFDEEQSDDDIAVANDGVTLLVDPLSFQYLMGAQVDYSETCKAFSLSFAIPTRPLLAVAALLFCLSHADSRFQRQY
jgi:iron-sulfur cluster assembly accessory protein